MKRRFKSKLMVAVLVASTIATVPVMAQGNGLRGDINADGRLTSTDVEYVKYMATIKTSDSAYANWADHLYKGDLNGDGEVTEADIEIIEELVNNSTDNYDDEKVTSKSQKFDVNRDGFVDKTDLRYVEYMKTVRSDSSDYDQWKDHLDKADFNNDGEVSSEDETMLRNYLGDDCQGDNCEPEDTDCQGDNCEPEDQDCQGDNCEPEDQDCQGDNCEPEDQDCEGDKCKTEQPENDDEKVYGTDFEFQDADGKNISLSQYKGKKVLMMYFASWCGACKSELASYDDFEGMLEDENIVFIALNYGEDASMVEDVLAANGYEGTLLFDNNYQISNQFSITGYPTNILIDENGEVLKVRAGSLSSATMSSFIE